MRARSRAAGGAFWTTRGTSLGATYCVSRPCPITAPNPPSLLTPHSSLFIPHSALFIPHSALLTPSSQRPTPHSPHHQTSPAAEPGPTDTSTRVERCNRPRVFARGSSAWEVRWEESEARNAEKETKKRKGEERISRPTEATLSEQTHFTPPHAEDHTFGARPTSQTPSHRPSRASDQHSHSPHHRASPAEEPGPTDISAEWSGVTSPGPPHGEVHA